MVTRGHILFPYVPVEKTYVSETNGQNYVLATERAGGHIGFGADPVMVHVALLICIIF